MLFYYIRHGDPCYDPDSLTEKGRRQAELLSLRQDFSNIDVIYSSSSVRAMQTAEPTAARLGLEILLLHWAHESRAWEATAVKDKTGPETWMFQREDYIRMFAQGQWRKQEKWYSNLDGRIVQSFLQYEKITDDFMLSIGCKHDRSTNTYDVIGPPHKKVAFFAHEGFGYLFLSCMLDIPYPELIRFVNRHTGVTVIEFPEGKSGIVPRILQFSDLSHLGV